ncbi:MAG: hypothetical protein E6J41_05360 [Chloroflexi bacterium]|nr:MAG: hypothetical protein E6J41_05360 [Chloroflexota bacterium]
MDAALLTIGLAAVGGVGLLIALLISAAVLQRPRRKSDHMPGRTRGGTSLYGTVVAVWLDALEIWLQLLARLLLVAAVAAIEYVLTWLLDGLPRWLGFAASPGISQITFVVSILLYLFDILVLIMTIVLVGFDTVTMLSERHVAHREKSEITNGAGRQ